MTVPPDSNAPDSGDGGAGPGDATRPETSSWPAYSPGPSPAYGQDPSAAYGQGPAAYGQGPWAGYGQGPYDTYAGGSPPLFDGPAPVLVSFPPPASQSRLTIAFRIILIIPHAIVLFVLGIAELFVVIVGWFAALVIGRLPEWAHTFISGVLRWSGRVYAYEYFLTGSYPPFSLDDDPAYPVRVVTARTRLNRFAVFFRVILLIPAEIVLSLANYGLVVVSFFVWLIALVAGRLPDSLHQALATIVRYQLRLTGYYFLVTPEYPWWGFFGDSPAQPTAAAPTDADVPPVAADPWQLQLSSAARGLVAGILAIGLVAYIVVSIVVPRANNNPVTAFSNAAGLVRVGEAYNKLTSSTAKFESASQACSGQLTCVTGQDRKEAGNLLTFAHTVKSAGLQGQPGTDASKLASDADGSAASLETLATATTVAQYQSDVTTTGIQQQLNSVDSDYQKLIHDLTGGS